MTVILAHGALGPFDEIIFFGIAVVFLGMMAVSWLRSQQVEEDEIDLAKAADRADADKFELE